MNKRRSLLSMTGAVVALVALSGSVMAAGPVFSNGSFETGTYVPDVRGTGLRPSRRLAEARAIDGWTVTKGNVDWTGQVSGRPPRARRASTSTALRHAPAPSARPSPRRQQHLRRHRSSLSGNPDNARRRRSAVKTMTVEAAGTPRSRTRYNTSTQVARRSHEHGLDQGLHVRGEELQHDADLHQHDRQRLGPAIDNVGITQTLATGADCKKSGWQTMVDKHRHFVPEPGRLRQLLRHRREEPRQLVVAASQPRTLTTTAPDLSNRRGPFHARPEYPRSSP